MLAVPVTLELERGRARLEALSPDHAADLFEAGDHDSIWRYMPIARPRTPADMRAYVERARRAGASCLPFAIVERESGRAVGSTRYLDIQPLNRSLEIGATWITPALQRTSINTECKFLLLRHAFEALGAVRVALKTDARNLESQRAIERVGATFEGRLRQHVILPDGYVRDTMMYSIVAAEWPRVSERLLRLLSG